MENNKKIKIENMNSIKAKVDGWTIMEDALLNCPIGSKVFLENGRLFTKFAYNLFEDSSYDNIRVSACYFFDKKIEEIQIPEYTRVVKSKGEILDKEEKKYLNAVITPFRSKVISIGKKLELIMNTLL